jgi:SGNH domain (fused to AT3 domains)
LPSTSEEPAQPVAPGALAPRPVVHPSRPLRVLVVGDSTALSLGPLLDEWGGNDQVWTVAKAAISGCGVVRSAFALNAYFPEEYERCAKWTTEWPTLIEQTKPDLVVLSTGFWDGTDRAFEGQPDWSRPNDPYYQQRVRADYELALAELTKSGAKVAWLDHPQVWFNEVSPLKLANPQIYEPWRMEVLDSIQREMVVGRPDIQVVESERFFSSWPGGMLDPTLRPDGLHIKGDGAAPLINWLAPEILHAYWMAGGQPG